jgi:hypothetical protein
VRLCAFVVANGAVFAVCVAPNRYTMGMKEVEAALEKKGDKAQQIKVRTCSSAWNVRK